MISAKKSTNTTTKAKGIVIQNDTLIDEETGECIIPILKSIYGNLSLDINISVKEDEEIPTEIGGDND